MATVPASIQAAFNEANRLWPTRSRASDGAVGDAAHAARASDHNPDGRGVVHAFDLTHDPAAGVDCHRLAAHVIDDPRIKYAIWDRRIWSREKASQGWRPYTGANPHTKHMHVSILSGPAPENDTRPWWDQAEEDDMPYTVEQLHKITKTAVREAIAEGAMDGPLDAAVKRLAAHDTATDKSVKAAVLAALAEHDAKG